MHISILDEDALINLADQSASVTLVRQSSANRRRSASLVPHGRRPMLRTVVRPSLLGAIEFRDVVNSLAQDSGAKTLAVFGHIGGDGHSHGYLVGSEQPTSRSRPVLQSRAVTHAVGGVQPWSEAHYAGHKRANSVAAAEGLAEDAIWEDAYTDIPRSAGEVTPKVRDLIDLSTGIDDPWKASSYGSDSTIAAAKREPAGNPSNSLRLSIPEDRLEQMHASPAAMTPASELPSAHKTLRKVPSLVLTGEGGQLTPIVIPGTPEAAPRFFRLPWANKGAERRKLHCYLRSIYGSLFPSMSNLKSKSIVGTVVSIVSIPALLVLVLTLPVVDEESEESCLDLEEKEHSGTHTPAQDGLDEEEQEGWRSRARTRDAHIAHQLHSPAMPHKRLSDDLFNSHTVDPFQLEDSLRRIEPDEADDSTPAHAFSPMPDDIPSPPASPRYDEQQAAADELTGKVLTVVQCSLAPIFACLTLFGAFLSLCIAAAC